MQTEDPPPAPRPPRPLVGGVERLDPALDALVAPDARLEVLAQGYKWSEGPVWTGGALLFSDVPNNVDLALERGRGRRASSCARAATPAASRAAASRARTAWPSTRTGRLYLCQHGDRRDRAAAPPTARRSRPSPTASRASASTAPTIWWCARTATSTSPIRSTAWTGTGRIRRARSPGAASTAARAGGGVDVLDKDADLPERPRVLARRQDAVRRACPIRRGRSGWPTTSTRTAASATGGSSSTRRRWSKAGKKGLPDGLKIDDDGNLFATGPGGVFVFSPAGKHLGTIVTGRADRQLRLRRRRLDAVHDRERQADAHPAQARGGRRQVAMALRRTPTTGSGAAVPLAAAAGQPRLPPAAGGGGDARPGPARRRHRAYMIFRLGFSVGGQVLAGILGSDRHLRLRRRRQARRELHPDDGRVGGRRWRRWAC